MRVISIRVLRDFWNLFPKSKSHLESWLNQVKHANWSQPADIKAQYHNASILKNNRVVFNIKGNDFRLVVSVRYKLGAIYIKFIGTHKQYDEIDVNTIEMEVKNGNTSNTQ